MKYETAFKNAFSTMQLFAAGDARRFLTRMGASTGYVRLFLHNMAARKEIFRISSGYYSFTDNEALAGFAFRPFYYGLGYALTIRGLWTQQSNPVIVTTTKTEPGIRSVMGHRVVVKRINVRAFFGFDYVKYSGLFVPVSTPEKTLIDFLYYKIHLDKETRSAIWKSADKKKIGKYARMLGIKARPRTPH